MKKKFILLFLMAFMFIPFVKVNAGITDGDNDGNITRKTTTYYHTIVEGNLSITGTDTYSKDYKMADKDEEGHYDKSDYIEGNYDDPVIVNVINNYKNDMEAIATGYHTTITTSTGGITSYFYDVHDEITQSNTGDNQITINTILDKYQIYRVNGKAVTKNIKTININLEGPFVGDEVTLTPIQGVCLNAGGCYTPSTRPNISTTDSHIELDALWVEDASQSLNDLTVNYYSGSIDKNQKYKALITVNATDGYRINDDVVVKVNGEDPDTRFNVMNDNGEIAVISEIDSQVRKVEYTLDDERGNQIIFTDYEGIVYVFNSTDILNMTDEEMEVIANETGKSIEELKEMGNGIIEAALNAVKGKGTLVGLYDFTVVNSGVPLEEVAGGFKIRIKMTDEMKKYDKFQIAFLKNDGTIDDLITLTKNGEYLEGVLPHLSTYAIIGNLEEKSSNPPTGDNIYLYIALLGLTVAGLYTKKKRFN